MLSRSVTAAHRKHSPNTVRYGTPQRYGPRYGRESHVVLPNDMASARLPCLKRHIGGMLTGRQILYPVDLKENAIIF